MNYCPSQENFQAQRTFSLEKISGVWTLWCALWVLLQLLRRLTAESSQLSATLTPAT